MSKVNVAVAVADDAQSRIYEVAAACRAAGLCHSTTLAMVGVLTGSVETDYLEELMAVPGVLVVEVACGGLAEISGRDPWRGGAD